ncbi:MAG: glycosyltransferase [Desulfobacterales bacterium]
METEISPSKYNILVVTDGLDRPEHEILSGLSNAGIRPDIICNPNYDRQQALKNSGIAVHPYYIKHRLDIKAIKFIRKQLKSRTYRIIYAIRNKALATSLFAAAGNKSIKIVGYRGTTGHLGVFNPESWITYLNPRLDHIVCVSEAVKSYLASRNVASAKLSTIYKGHDVAWYQEPKSHPEPADFPIPEDVFVVGFIGNIRPVKGVSTLLRALKYIPKRKNIYFLVIGDIRDTKVKKMQADPAVISRAHFTGYKKNAAGLLRLMNVFVMPSIAREGLPRALLEAMAQKIPPIVTDVGGMPEVVTAHETGLIVPPQEPAKLAEAILFLYDNPKLRQKLGENAKNRIEKDFNIRNTVSQTIALLDQLAS